MNPQLCFKSLYESCTCNLHTHLVKNIPIVDSHCHLDDFLNSHSNFQMFSNSNSRHVFLISNKHKYDHWDSVFSVSHTNIHVYETYGLHPKYLPERDLVKQLNHLKKILAYNFHPISGRPIVAIGETGLDETSRFSFDYQYRAFREQVLLAKTMKMPLVLHRR